MSQDFKIIEVIRSKPFNSKYGEMISYTLTVDGGEGYPMEVEINQKNETPAPLEGQSIYGHVDETEYGYKLKKDQRPEPVAPVASPRPAAAPSAVHPNDDARQSMIVRQSSLKVAMDFLIANATTTRFSKEDVVEAAKYFAAYAETGEAS